ncbi:hypothetical protein GCM10010341_25070 [Streptomyces noursei]|nr:hypothetical protein GCM10010341_25070 [Streptomyces noursei]
MRVRSRDDPTVACVRRGDGPTVRGCAAGTSPLRVLAGSSPLCTRAPQGCPTARAPQGRFRCVCVRCLVACAAHAPAVHPLPPLGTPARE